MNAIVYKIVTTPVGKIVMGATSAGCCLVEFYEKEKFKAATPKMEKLHQAQFIEDSNSHLQIAEKELREYFEGLRQQFSVPLDIKGTPFEMNVWQELLKIPYGQLVSYETIAKRINHPHAMRAVGNANNHNHIAIIIPCHRVIGKNGNLVGYGGGMKTKKFLITLEGAAEADLFDEKPSSQITISSVGKASVQKGKKAITKGTQAIKLIRKAALSKGQ